MRGWASRPESARIPVLLIVEEATSFVSRVAFLLVQLTLAASVIIGAGDVRPPAEADGLDSASHAMPLAGDDDRGDGGPGPCAEVAALGPSVQV